MKFTRDTLKENKLLLLFYLTLIISITILSGLNFNIEMNGAIEIIETVETQAVSNKIDIVHHLMTKHSFTDIKILAQRNVIQKYIENKSEHNKEEIIEQMIIFTEITGVYDKIFYINETGMEIAGVDYNEGEPLAITESELQNRSSDYCFKDTIVLEEGQVFVSPLDLNIENGLIEIPFKPIIRFGTPVFDYNGTKRGIVIINYCAEEIISAINEDTFSKVSKNAILNNNGYWILGLDPELEWGFMLENGTENTIENEYPGVWSLISNSTSGQFRTNNGLLTYRTFYPLTEGYIYSSGSMKPYEPSNDNVSSDAYYWKILTIISNDEILKIQNEIFSSYLIYYSIIFAVTTIFSFSIGFLLNKQKMLEKEIQREIVEKNRMLIVQRSELFEYARTMNHDLRGVFTKIQMSAYALHKKGDKKYLDNIGNYISDITTTLDHSLKVAGTGTLVGEKNPIKLIEVLKRAAEVTLPKDVNITFQNIPEIKADKEKLFQVFKNLFENAITHGKARNIKIWHESGKEYSLLKISNDGEKVSEERKKELWMNLITKKKRTSGLGLTIIQKIIEGHGWDITISDTKETEFIIHIPIKDIL